MFKQPVVLKEADILLRKAEKNYKKGKFWLGLAKMFAFMGLLCFVLVILDLPLMNGEPILNFDDQQFSTLLLLGAGSNLLALFTVLLGNKRLRDAYDAIHDRSEIYRQAPFMMTSV